MRPGHLPKKNPAHSLRASCFGRRGAHACNAISRRAFRGAGLSAGPFRLGTRIFGGAREWDLTDDRLIMIGWGENFRYLVSGNSV